VTSNGAHQIGHGHGTKLRIVIDGRAHPELIRDDYAYRHLLVATAPSEAKSPQLRLLQKGIVGRMGLGAADRAAYEDALRRVRVWEEIERIRRDRQSLDLAAKQGSPTVGVTLVALMAEERELIRRAKQELHRSLSPSGLETLDKYVQNHVKRQITIVGGVLHHGLPGDSE
jgi:hypothetical protein